jgi:hypothetical protein
MYYRTQRDYTGPGFDSRGWFDGVCGGRAPALGLAITLIAAACGGGDDDGSGAGGADAAPSCEERRAEAGRPSSFSDGLVRIQARGTTRAIALAPPRSAPLPPVTSRPARALRRLPADSPASAIGLRLLLVTPTEDRPSYQAAAAALQRIGVPHDVLLSGTDPLDEALLYDESGACRYSGLILSHDGLGFDDGTGWKSSLSEAEWALLAEYEASCGAREVIWYARPSAELGLSETSEFDDSATETMTLTDAGAAQFPYLVRDAAIPVQLVFGYRAAVAEPDTTQPLFETASGGVLAAAHTRADGTEVLAITVDSGNESVHSQLLEFGVVDWVTRGLFIGKRRVYLSPHIDDVFLKSALWTDGGGESTYRMTADDVAHLLDWRGGLSSRLPERSTFRIQLAFNGAGSQPALFPDQSLVTALLDAEDQFFWINHTWDHANLDGVDENTAQGEIAQNCAKAEEWQLTHFQCSEAVTPELTGLDNPDAVAGLLAAGVRHVVSDASKTEALDPDNPGSNPRPNVGRRNPHDPELFQVPRHPTSIFFDVSTVAEEVGLYNELYREYWGRDLTYEEIIDKDTEIGLAYLLSYDVDPLMFHQANLRFWSDDGWHSLYTDWMDRLIERFTALVNLPIVGLEMSDIATVMKDRAALDSCGVTATLSADRKSIHLESVGACVVPITGLDAPDAGDVQHYGGVATTHVVLSGCDSRDIDLP